MLQSNYEIVLLNMESGSLCKMLLTEEKNKTNEIKKTIGANCQGTPSEPFIVKLFMHLWVETVLAFLCKMHQPTNYKQSNNSICAFFDSLKIFVSETVNVYKKYYKRYS